MSTFYDQPDVLDYLNGKTDSVINRSYREAVETSLLCDMDADDVLTICREMPVEHTGTSTCPCNPLILAGNHGMSLDEVFAELEKCNG